jgi:hypothetical protein
MMSVVGAASNQRFKPKPTIGLSAWEHIGFRFVAGGRSFISASKRLQSDEFPSSGRCPSGSRSCAMPDVL